MERLRLNKGRYQGESIDIDKILGEIHEFAVSSGWTASPIDVPGRRALPAYERLVEHPTRLICISAGIHGDEPAGPLAARALFQQCRWPSDVNLWLIPCLNPEGFALNTRGDKDGIDLNRDYRSFKAPVTQAHVQWLKERPRFDMTLLLHEDWEADGFYLYELNPKRGPSMADAIIAAVREVCPIDMSPTIEGRPAENGVICANPDLLKRPDWPEAFYLVHNKTPISYTLEAPSDYALSVRVAALVAGARAVL